MPNLCFTDLTVQKLKEGSYFDTCLPSFGIRVGKHRKTWMVMRGRTRTRIALGHYPAVSLADAKKKARIELGQELSEQKTASLPMTKRSISALPITIKTSVHVLVTRLNAYCADFYLATWLTLTTSRSIISSLKLVETPSEQLHAFRALRVFFKWCTQSRIRNHILRGAQDVSLDNFAPLTLRFNVLKLLGGGIYANTHSGRCNIT